MYEPPRCRQQTVVKHDRDRPSERTYRFGGRLLRPARRGRVGKKWCCLSMLLSGEFPAGRRRDGVMPGPTACSGFSAQWFEAFGEASRAFAEMVMAGEVSSGRAGVSPMTGTESSNPFPSTGTVESIADPDFLAFISVSCSSSWGAVNSSRSAARAPALVMRRNRSVASRSPVMAAAQCRLLEWYPHRKLRFW